MVLTVSSKDNLNSCGSVSESMSNNNKNKIDFVAENTRFIVSKELFANNTDTMFYSIFDSSASLTKANKKGEYQCQCQFQLQGSSPTVSKAILGYFKCGEVICAANWEHRQQFLIPFDASVVKCFNLRGLLKQLINDSPRKHFEKFIQKRIVSEMVITTKRGDRQCHVVIPLNDDIVDLDEEYRPQTGEEYSQIIHSTPMHRFFKFIENRDVSKQVLKERGLNSE